MVWRREDWAAQVRLSQVSEICLVALQMIRSHRKSPSKLQSTYRIFRAGFSYVPLVVPRAPARN